MGDLHCQLHPVYKMKRERESEYVVREGSRETDKYGEAEREAKREAEREVV